MTTTCTHLQDDWELYALGSLPADAQESMAAHLEAGCRECQRRYLEAQAVLTAMSSLAPARRPSPSVERKLMRAITAAQARIVAAWSFWKAVPWAFACACLLAVIWFARDRFRLESELGEARQNSSILQRDQKALQDELQAKLEAEKLEAEAKSVPVATPPSLPAVKHEDDAKLRAQLEEAQNRIRVAEADKAAAAKQVAELQNQLASGANRSASLERELRAAAASADRAGSEKTAILAAELAKSQAETRRLSAAADAGDKIERLLQSASLQQISLRSVDPKGGHATARALYSPQGGLLLVADALPKLPGQKCYQLWLIKKGAPAILSGGLITLQDDGKGVLFAPPSSDLAEVTALAITDEPAGGSVAARGRKLLFGPQ
jgi:anti-sigma-K factor RskA